jgi:hypothetical protein
MQKFNAMQSVSDTNDAFRQLAVHDGDLPDRDRRKLMNPVETKAQRCGQEMADGSLAVVAWNRCLAIRVGQTVTGSTRCSLNTARLATVRPEPDFLPVLKAELVEDLQLVCRASAAKSSNDADADVGRVVLW